MTGRARMQETNIYDLTAQESASAGSPHSKLLIEAFTAIAQEQLRARFGDSASTIRSPAQPGYTWGAMVRQGIAALERKPHFFARWFRFIFVDLDDYRRWRNDANEESVVVVGQEPRRVNQRKLQAAVRSYIDSERNEGRQASQKRLWIYVKAVLPGATYRQAVDAMRAVEGRRKKRGRPRKAEAPAR